MCVGLIKKYEGLRLQAYKCPAGVLTIGYGNTSYPDGTPIKENDIITKEYAEALLNDYCVREVYPVFGKIPFQLTNRQKEAIASLVYNWNAAGFLKSKLYKAICANDWEAVCREWDYGFKNNLIGLYKRRVEELHYFLWDL